MLSACLWTIRFVPFLLSNSSLTTLASFFSLLLFLSLPAVRTSCDCHVFDEIISPRKTVNAGSKLREGETGESGKLIWVVWEEKHDGFASRRP